MCLIIAFNQYVWNVGFLHFWAWKHKTGRRTYFWNYWMFCAVRHMCENRDGRACGEWWDHYFPSCQPDLKKRSQDPNLKLLIAWLIIKIICIKCLTLERLQWHKFPLFTDEATDEANLQNVAYDFEASMPPSSIQIPWILDLSFLSLHCR